MNERPRKRKKQKPVRTPEGDLVTPVSGLPAAPINWAPPCQSCQTRTCSDCSREVPHMLSRCNGCGCETLSDAHRCPDTISTGTLESSVGTRQRVKCRVCGTNFSWVVKRKDA